MVLKLKFEQILIEKIRFKVRRRNLLCHPLLAWFQPYGIKKRQIYKSLLIFSFLSHLYYTDTRKGTSRLFNHFYHQHWKFVVLCKVSICFIEKSLTIVFMRPVVSLKSQVIRSMEEKLLHYDTLAEQNITIEDIEF